MYKRRTGEMSTIMRKSLLVCLVAIAALAFAGCKISTPEIRGLVLDEATGEPVEGAWVKDLLQSTTMTVAGDTHGGVSLAELHTRTSKDGRFVIPARKIKKAPPPYGFGTTVNSYSIGAGTIDDRGGNIQFRDEEKLKEFLKKKIIEFTIHVSPINRTEKEEFRKLQNLDRYCTTGRGSFERPPVEGGCDEWELDFAITRHERFLERIGEPEDMDQRIHFAGTMEQLAYLYKRKGDYSSAIETFKEVKAFNEERGITRNIKSYEIQIKELEKLLLTPLG
jgi:hypothetical protein